ncbi:NUDIX domain-containing protein [Streptomyces sp. McG5]|uniref:NUDIX domain-containing protein n=1 Tax=unclassified Streptomyces TaxID=2593676 RepID=UPI001BE6A5BC|nr:MULTISPECIES: NUDIX domain-containing protein [unclassified Streptomyces]MBT2887388.1 NUDIX domain-containing protein [Streptomyces sp. McG5]MBT2893244.1 NUDIX domain-containing protein [Streptomyces sp. McG2]
MTRTEYYDDPQAPQPNSLVVAASAVVTDDQGRVLMQRRADSGLWALPGGGMELSDTLPGTAVREVKEETGLDVTPGPLVRLTSGYRLRAEAAYEARLSGGTMRLDPREILDAGWYAPDRLPPGLIASHRELILGVGAESRASGAG